MLRGKRQRKLISGAGIALAAAIVLWFSLPLWFPWVLPLVARKQGVQYRHYERLGYRSFALHGVTFTNRTVTIRAERLEGLVPSIWLWRCVWKRGEQIE